MNDRSNAFRYDRRFGYNAVAFFGPSTETECGMKRIALYGKGGIGKSTLAAAVSMCAALKGRRVLHVGCDPKHDSTYTLADGHPPVPVVEVLLRNDDRVSKLEEILVTGRNGIDLVEAGGPEPGIGCGGRGIARMLDIFDDFEVMERGYDLTVFDVLGDVVCGGFAGPLRQGFAELVFIVTSEEMMSLYAANNVARMIVRLARNGSRLGGLLVNRRDNNEPLDKLEEFARRIGAPIVGVVPRDARIRKAELAGRTVVEQAPDSEVAGILSAIAERVEGLPLVDAVIPTPLDEKEFYAFARTPDTGAQDE